MDEKPTAGPSRVEKMLRLLGMATKHPGEFLDRARTIVAGHHADAPSTQSPVGHAEMLAICSRFLGVDFATLLEEPAVAEIEATVKERQGVVARTGPFGSFHDADFALARVCYGVCRARRPAVVVETGVGYGVTTAFVLQALVQNGRGELWSVDLPPLGKGADEYVGFLVPQPLRERWCLVRGSARRALPGLLAELPALDLFIHDSLHTYAHMNWEFESAWARLAPDGVLLSDDVGMNRAFEEFAAAVSPACSLVGGKARGGSYGIVFKPGAP